MKNEFLARAITNIDDSLIEEASVYTERRKPRSSFNIARWASIAACFVMIATVMGISMTNRGNVLLYGQSISNAPTPISEYIPVAVSYSMEPKTASSETIPLALDFGKKTTLTIEGGAMIVLSKTGEEIFVGTSYEANDQISICIQPAIGNKVCTISTDRGYDILLSMNDDGVWYIHTAKQ